MKIPIPLFRRKKFLIGLFTLIFISIPIGFLSLKYARPTAAAWFDDSWAYRKAIAIPSHTAVENNVYVTVPSFDATDTSRFQADCGDLRFTKQNGELLPYYVVTCSATANIHVQFDTLPAGASTYFMYYGNPSADNGFSAADFSAAASGLGSQTLAAEEQSAGPVAYWKFDEGYGTVANDSTANANTGNLGVGSSAPTWQTEDMCISGKCLKFDGSNDYVNAGSGTSLNITGAITIEGWIKLNTLTTAYADPTIVSKYAGTGAGQRQYLLSYRNSGGQKGIAFYVVSDANVLIASYQIDWAPEINRWYHVVAVYKPNEYMRTYIDNLLVKQTTSGIPSALQSAPSINVEIGRYSTQYFPGFLDDVKIYPYARTAAQIKSDFRSRGTSKGTSASLGGSKDNLDALSNGLVGYWKTDEATWSGTLNEVVDSSGNANHGQAQGATGGKAYPTTGKFGNAGYFDGVDDNFLVSSLTTLGTDFSASFWVKPTSLPGSYQVAFGATQGSNTVFGSIRSDGQVSFRTSSSSAFDELLSSGAGIQTGNWYHVVLIKDNSGRKIYVNGVQKGSDTSTLWTTTISNFSVGMRSASSLPFNGYIDDVRIYNRALSPKEVRDLYNWAPGPYTYLTFDEGTGNNIYDKSGNGYSGTWNGSGTHWATGKFGKAAKFNGSSDYISFTSLPKPANLPITIEFWAQPTTSTPVGIFDSAPSQQYVFRNYSSGNVEWWNVSPSISMGLTASVWTHLAFIYDYSGGNQTITWYKNGIKQTTGSTAAAGTWAWTTFRLGNINGGSAGWYSGNLDEFKIYNYARTAKQIVEDMNAGHPAPGSPVGSQVGYWKFDEGYGSTANNSGFGGTTLNGSLGVGTSAPSWSNSGKIGKALSLDGSNDYLALSNRISMSSDFSISSWIKASSKATQVIVGTNQNTGGLRLSNTNITLGPSGTYVATWTGARPSNDTWHHIAVSVNRTSDLATLYIDGISKGTQSVTNFDWSTSNERFTYFGKDYCSATDCWFSGLIDEVKIYNSALTQDEILLDMNQGSTMVLGSLSDTSGLTGGSVASNSASAAYCIPGDTASCSAPVAEWKMEEGSGQYAYDTSGNSFTGTLGANNTPATDDPTWSTGKIGKALQFNGSATFVKVAGNSVFNFDYNQNFTVSTWIKAPTAQGGTSSTARRIIDFPGSTGYPFTMWFRSETGSPANKITVARYDGTNNPGINSTNTLNDNQWHYVTFSKNNATLSLYIDGKLDNSANDTTTTSTLSDNNLYFGSSSGTSNYFNGLIDHVRIYNYARSAAQIAWDYNRGGPVGWWKLDECQGITANDASGNANNGTITIGPTGTQSVLGTCSVGVGSTAAWGNGSVGKYNSSLNFDGTDDYVTAGTNSSLQITGTVVTTSAWIKTSDNQGGIIKRYLTTSPWEGYAMSVGGSLTNGKLGFWYGNGTAWDFSNNTVNDNVWHHVAVVFDSSNSYFYIDGKLDRTVAKTGTVGLSSATTAEIGDENNTRYFTGQIDDVRIYNYALTPTQVKTLFNENSGVRFGPLTGSP